jgi:hypothetical protein
MGWREKVAPRSATDKRKKEPSSETINPLQNKETQTNQRAAGSIYLQQENIGYMEIGIHIVCPCECCTYLLSMWAST